MLSISAVWCYWCHVMDETSYSDPDVARLIDQSFIAIRVDNDHRPDLNSRYNVGGWPTTAFLTGHGGLIGGATYLPPDQFLSMLSGCVRLTKKTGRNYTTRPADCSVNAKTGPAESLRVPNWTTHFRTRSPAAWPARTMRSMAVLGKNLSSPTGPYSNT